MRIWLSPPHMSGRERAYVEEAFETNWIAPLGPHVDAFEREFEAAIGGAHAVATVSGTSALLVALRLAGVGPGDEVLVSTFTFVASVTPILERGATPVFVDADPETWNLDPALVAEAIERRARRGRAPKAVVIVHLYGQSADLDPILEACEAHGVIPVEDAAEALGATYRDRSVGTLADRSVFSFNGNKIITTGGGGMLVTKDAAEAERARKWITQAREDVPHYEHVELGYNFRLSNVLAGIGRGQLEVLPERVEARRANFDHYLRGLGDLPGVAFMPEAGYGRSTRWLTCLTIDPREFGVDREAVRAALEGRSIESRPVWKPMHLQPALAEHPAVGGSVAERLFETGLCLPSGSALTEADRERVIGIVRDVFEEGRDG